MASINFLFFYHKYRLRRWAVTERLRWYIKEDYVTYCHQSFSRFGETETPFTSISSRARQLAWLTGQQHSHIIISHQYRLINRLTTAVKRAYSQCLAIIIPSPCYRTEYSIGHITSSVLKPRQSIVLKRVFLFSRHVKSKNNIPA
jgi:hypothetical protein